MNIMASSRLMVAGILCAMLCGLSGCKSTTTVDGVQVDPKGMIPGATEADAKKRALVRLQLAADYYQNGQLQTAIDTAQMAAQLDPSSGQTFGLLGLMYMDAGQTQKAQESFDRALSIDGGNPELQNNYGWYLCLLGKESQAFEYFHRAEANPLYRTPALAYQNEGICQRRIKQLPQAEQSLLHAFSLDAVAPTIKYQLTELYLSEGRWDRADFYYDLLSRSVEPSAGVLWLGIRLAHAKGDADAQHTLSEQLNVRFPNTSQADSLHRGRFDE
jgi:type IV pilus assembly protein PilF